MKKYIPILTILLMLATIACRKYKEDSFISFRKPEKRLLGNWKIVAFEVDGVDSLVNLYTYADYSDCTFNFVYDKGNSIQKLEGCVNNWTNGWGIDKNDFYLVDYFIYPNRKIYKIQPFKVIKLYKNDFWVQKDIYGKNYLLKFKKQ